MSQISIALQWQPFILRLLTQPLLGVDFLLGLKAQFTYFLISLDAPLTRFILRDVGNGPIELIL